MSRSPVVVRTVPALRRAVEALRTRKAAVALVPTMGLRDIWARSLAISGRMEGHLPPASRQAADLIRRAHCRQGKRGTIGVRQLEANLIARVEPVASAV